MTEMDWYESHFNSNGHLFHCCEQYIMWEIFHDYETATRILATASLARQRELRRQVRGFREDVWSANRRRVLNKGLYGRICPDHQDYSHIMFILLLQHSCQCHLCLFLQRMSRFSPCRFGRNVVDIDGISIRVAY